MDFFIGDEIIYDEKKYVIMDNIPYKNKKYFFLSTTEKPITGDVVEYKIENDELYINNDISDEIKKDVLLIIANNIKIKENW